MDIAKIRKKIQQSETDHSANGQTRNEIEIQTEESNRKEAEPTTGSQERIPQAISKADTEKEAVTKEKKADIEKKKEEAKTEAIAEKIESTTAEDLIEILVFNLMKEEFAFKISQLEEILRPQRITKVPKMPDYVLGITSLRGKVIPVIDLKLILSLTDRLSPTDDRVKILIIKGPKGPIGATVDRVTGVLRIAKSEILPPPAHLTETELKFIDSVAVMNKHFISIINLDEAISINIK